MAVANRGAMTPQLPRGSSLLLATAFAACASAPSTSNAPAPVLPHDAAVLAPRGPDTGPQDPPPRETKRERNPWEVLVAATGNNNEEFGAGAASGIGSVGYYFNEWLEVSARQNASYAHAGEGQQEIWNFASRGALDVHFPIGKVVVPYVGVNAGYAYGDSIDDSLMAGPEGGVKLYLQDDAFLQLGTEYEFFFDKGDSLDSAFAEGQFLWTLGMGMRF